MSQAWGFRLEKHLEKFSESSALCGHCLSGLRGAGGGKGPIAAPSCGNQALGLGAASLVCYRLCNGCAHALNLCAWSANCVPDAVSASGVTTGTDTASLLQGVDILEEACPPNNVLLHLCGKSCTMYLPARSHFISPGVSCLILFNPILQTTFSHFENPPRGPFFPRSIHHCLSKGGDLR